MPDAPFDMPDSLQGDRESARRPLKLLRRRLPIILACAVITPAVAVGYALTQPTKYTATSVLLFRNSGFENSIVGNAPFLPNTDPARDAATNLKLVTLAVVSQAAARQLGHGLTGPGIANSISASQQGQSDLVSVAATSRNKVLAAKIANAFARQFIIFRRDADRAKILQAKAISENVLKTLPPIAAKGDQGRSLRQRINELDTLATLQTGNAELVQPANTPTSPSSPQPKRDGLLGLGFGLMLGLGLAILLDRLDRRLRDPKEVEELLRRPVLGAIPRSRVLSRGRIGQRPLPAGEAEAFRMLRASLRYFNVDSQVHSVLITSAAPGDGKSTVAANLAFAAAEAGSKVLLLEADLRHPTLAHLLQIPSTPGLTNVLASDKETAETVQRVPVPGREATHLPTRELDVIVSGPIPPNPSDLMESDHLRQVIRQAEVEYDLVVIDTPPTAVVSDAMPLINQTSGVIVVARLGKTTRDGLIHLRNQLEHLEARLLGIVVNSLGRDTEGYGYGYAYSYGSDYAKQTDVGEADAVPVWPETPAEPGTTSPGDGESTAAVTAAAEHEPSERSHGAPTATAWEFRSESPSNNNAPGNGHPQTRTPEPTSGFEGGLAGFARRIRRGRPNS